MHDPGDGMLAKDVVEGVGARDVDRLPLEAAAELVPDELRLAPHAKLRRDDVFAEIEQGANRVQADESGPAGH